VGIANDPGVRLHARHLDAGKVFAGATTDHPRHPVQVISETTRTSLQEARASLLLETCLIVLEFPGASVEGCPDPCGRRQAGHLPHGRTQPVGVQAPVASPAALGSGVVDAEDVAAHDRGFTDCRIRSRFRASRAANAARGQQGQGSHARSDARAPQMDMPQACSGHNSPMPDSGALTSCQPQQHL
jgi:hypothetical protein